MKCALFLALVLGLTAQSSADKLDMFAGTWSGVGSMAGEGNTTTKIAGTNKCAWSDGKAFLICDGTAHIGGKVFHGISVFNYDEASHAYKFLNINSGGANRTSLTFADNTWSFDDEDTDASGHKIYTRTLNIFDSPDKYRFIMQTSTDKVHWKATGSGTSTRIP